jgi:hypothetical protein
MVWLAVGAGVVSVWLGLALYTAQALTRKPQAASSPRARGVECPHVAGFPPRRPLRRRPRAAALHLGSVPSASRR